jgi:hypothetical protein
MKSLKYLLQNTLNLALLGGLVVFLILLIRSFTSNTPWSPLVGTPLETPSVYPPPRTVVIATSVAIPPPYPLPSPLPQPARTATPIPTYIEVSPREFMAPSLTPHPTFTPYPSPTMRPGPSSTPIPLAVPAKDPSGEIKYFERKSDGYLSFNSLTVDATSHASGSPVTSALNSPLSDGTLFYSPDGNLLGLQDPNGGMIYDLQIGEMIDPVKMPIFQSIL